MTSSTNQRISKTLGALLGVHCGDSLGATLEFMPWSDIIRKHPKGLREIVGGGHFDWPAGHATDDTDLTRAVLLAYRDYEENKQAGSTQSVKEFNVAKAAAEYSLQWRMGQWPGREKGSRPNDIGGATDTGLHNYKRLRDPTRSGVGFGSAGNGSLMRCIPTGLFASGERRQNESIAISGFTHNDPRCTVSCASYNEIVAALVDGKSPREAVEIGKTISNRLGCDKVTTAIIEGETLQLSKIASEGPRGGMDVSTHGYVLNALRISIAALLDPRSFEDALIDVVRLGGDTDTNGAIAGGLLGARDGIENIPLRWLEKLQFRKEFEEVATHILQLQQQSG
ncbi:ADP-ribosylglycohydrolase family protein [Lophiostoma macrostomum CBS 122681]|uniref:ADP-ribosylhydrolase ARH3 n=1 Tax=Lophiostoma macrostomum CBS 122681 TaxID=1314788 RepID=A0A6A6SRT0_9PLEO|nr:ADP-ribosylglycohydrolase family protein [Lophiostoma macrostomum CBS 122681]